MKLEKMMIVMMMIIKIVMTMNHFVAWLANEREDVFLNQRQEFSISQTITCCTMKSNYNCLDGNVQ